MRKLIKTYRSFHEFSGVYLATIVINERLVHAITES